VLPSALRGIVREAGTDREIIFIDDASIDGTQKLLTRYTAIHYVRNEQRKGVAACRNLGLSMAKGDVVTFLDAHVWPKMGTFDYLQASAQSNDALIACPFSNTRDPKNLKYPSPVNYGGGPSFSARKNWFYMHVERRDSRWLARRSGCFAVGLTAKKSVWNDLDGWVRLPGMWSGNDAAMTIKAWRFDVPVLVESRALLYHLVKSFSSHATTGTDQIKNRVYAARVLFGESTFERFWKGRFQRGKWWRGGFDEMLRQEGLLEESRRIEERAQKTPQEFLRAFVLPRLEKPKQGGQEAFEGI